MPEVNVIAESEILKALFTEIKATTKEIRLKKDDEVIIRRSMEFEPFGKATETYEEVWRIEIPSIQYHWKGTKGWVRGKEGLCLQFKGRTLEATIHKATTTLKELSLSNSKMLSNKRIAEVET